VYYPDLDVNALSGKFPIPFLEVLVLILKGSITRFCFAYNLVILVAEFSPSENVFIIV